MCHMSEPSCSEVASLRVVGPGPGWDWRTRIGHGPNVANGTGLVRGPARVDPLNGRGLLGAFRYPARLAATPGSASPEPTRELAESGGRERPWRRSGSP